MEEAAVIAGVKVSRLQEIKSQKTVSEKTYVMLVKAALKARELEAEARARAAKRATKPPVRLSYEERQRLRALVAEKQRQRYHRERLLGINR